MWGCKETGVEARLPQNSLRKCTRGALHPHLYYALKNQTEYFNLFGKTQLQGCRSETTCTTSGNLNSIPLSLNWMHRLHTCSD